MTLKKCLKFAMTLLRCYLIQKKLKKKQINNMHNFIKHYFLSDLMTSYLFLPNENTSHFHTIIFAKKKNSWTHGKQLNSENNCNEFCWRHAFSRRWSIWTVRFIEFMKRFNNWIWIQFELFPRTKWMTESLLPITGVIQSPFRSF